MLRASLGEVEYEPAPGGVLYIAIAELEALKAAELLEGAIDDAPPR